MEVRCETQPEERVAISGSDWQLGRSERLIGMPRKLRLLGPTTVLVFEYVAILVPHLRAQFLRYLKANPCRYPLWQDRIPMPSPGGQFKASLSCRSWHPLFVCDHEVFIKNTVGQFVWEPLPCNRTWPRSCLTPDTEVKLTCSLKTGRSR